MPAGKPQSKRSTMSLRDALYGFALVVLPLFFINGSHDQWNLPRWVLALAFLSIALPLAAFRKPETSPFPKVFLTLCLFWLGWTALSAISIPNAGDALYLMGIRLVGIGMVMWLGMQRDVDRLIPALMVLGLVEAVIGLGEFAGLVTMNELMQVPIGTVGNNNIYGCLMALLVPFPLLMAVKSTGQKRTLALAAAGIIAALALVSTSKTAVLALGIAVVVLTGIHFLKYKTGLLKRAKVSLFILILIPLLLIAAPIAWAGMSFSTGQIPTEATTGITERGLMWRETLDLCQQAPFLGHGPAGWKYQMLEKGLTGYSTVFGLRYFTRPHNDFLWIAAESGIPAALAYVSLLTFLFVSAVRQAWRQATGGMRNHFYLLASGVLIWIVISSLNFPLERVDHVLVFAGLVALIFAGEGQVVERKKVAVKIAGGLAALVFTTLTVIGWGRLQTDFQLQKIVVAHEAGRSGEVLAISSQMTNQFFTADYYSSTPIVWYEGIALLQTGRKEEALEKLKLAYVVNRFHPHVVNNLASNYVMLGEYEQAGKYYLESIRRFREFADPYVNLSRIFVAQGDTLGATDLLRSFPGEPVSHRQAIQQELELLGY